MHIDVREETDFKTDISLKLKKIAMVAESGWFEWWNKLLVSRTGGPDNLNEPPVKPNMSGNILVIIVDWLTEIAYSCSMFGGKISRNNYYHGEEKIVLIVYIVNAVLKILLKKYKI